MRDEGGGRRMEGRGGREGEDGGGRSHQHMTLNIILITSKCSYDLLVPQTCPIPTCSWHT